jgi:predicted GNAT family acetyltransferase
VTSITDNPALHRFETTTEGQISFLTYRREGSSLVLLHTEVPEALGGRGIGSALTRHALETARADGLSVVPLCSFVATYIERRPEYRTLIKRR